MQFKNIGKLFTKNLIIAEIVLVLMLIIMGAFTFHLVEGWRVLDSFYFIISTMSTIGLGDFLPQTDLGKGFFMFYAIIGVPFFVSIGGLFLETRFKKSIEHYLKKVYKDIRQAEEEIEEIEDTAIRNLKRNLESTQEIVEDIEEEIQETHKSRWKKMFKRNKNK